MRWRVLAESVGGTSHVRTSTPCQDASRCEQLKLGGEDVLIAICSDGAGSAERSELGARIACDQFFDVASATLESWGSLDLLGRKALLGWYEEVRTALAAEADVLGVPIRQLACTLLTAVVGEERAWFAQIGDGSIVFHDGERYQSAFWPQSGEYVNATNFVTQSGLESCFEVVEREGRIDELALFTDGMQRLALDYGARSAHQGFFHPLFKRLREANDEGELSAPLRAMLDSPSVNQRTDDDKTLVLASRAIVHASQDAAS